MKPKALRHYTFRFMLGYVACLSVAVFITLCIAFLFYAVDYFSKINNELENELNLIEQAFDQHGVIGVDVLQEKNNQQRLFDYYAYILIDSNNQKLSGDLNEWPAYYLWRDGWLSFDSQVLISQQTHRFFFVGRQRELNQGNKLLVAINVKDIRQNITLVSRSLFWSMLMMSILGLVGAIILSRKSLERVEKINNTIDAFIDGDLSARVPIDNTGDDFETLSKNLNYMLLKIENSINEIKLVSDNIAHDLKTPLTVMKNKLSLISEKLESDNQLLIDEVIEESDRLLSIFDSILRISRIETGIKKSHFSHLNLTHLINEAIELYLPVAETRAISIDIEADKLTPIFGDADLLFQMLTNLLDNAIKYLPDSGKIKVVVYHQFNSIWVYVADNGYGIDKNLEGKVLQRFYRAKKNRPQGEGNGLGLSFVNAVVILHEGEITLSSSDRFFKESETKGLTVMIKLPKNVG